MALQVWLPLDNSFNNLGVMQEGITVSGGAYVNGKVTSKALGTGSVTIDSTNASRIMNNIAFSLSVWVKNIKDNPSSGTVTTSIFNTASRPRRFSIFMYPLYSTLHLSSSTNDATTNNLAYTVSDFFPKDVWVHLALTYGNGKVTLYKNGTIVRSDNATFSVTDWNSQTIRMIETDGNRYLNDFRLYDHCLSLKEVKNLAKGLMLHYTLSRPQANLFKNSLAEKSWTYTGTSYKDSNYSQETITPDADSYYTMSFDAKSDRESSGIFKTYLYNNNTGRQCDSVKGYLDGVLVYTGTSDAGTCTMPTYTYYRHYVIVRHFNTNATALTKSNVFRIQNPGSTALTMYVKNAKLELGDKATPWIPNSADTLYTTMGFANNIEDDTSGYNNNGTRTNITTWNTDTARYLSSMVFNGSNAYLQLSKNLGNVYNSDFSLSVWLKPSVAKRGVILSEYQATGASNVAFELTATLQLRVWWNGTPDIKTTNSISVNTWSHVVITKTSTQILFYVNGSLFYTHNQSGGFSERISNALPRIGDDYRTGTDVDYNGLMSDFRLYATALSESDVKELYQTSASIDKNNNMHCYELVES